MTYIFDIQEIFTSYAEMSEAESNIEGCVFCKIGQNEIPETELLYDDVDYAVFRFVNLIL